MFDDYTSKTLLLESVEAAIGQGPRIPSRIITKMSANKP